MENSIKNLEQLCKQPGVSGYEEESGILNFLFEMVKNINPNTEIDRAGNIVSVIENPGETILLEAHMDETGFLVVENDGQAVLFPQGTVEVGRIADNDVFVVGKNIKGKIAIGPENDFIFTHKNNNDIGKIAAGDIVAFERSFIKDENEIKASALDNRIGCYVLLEILSMAVKNGSKNRLVFAFSRKEEIDMSSFEDIVKHHKNAFSIVVDAAYAHPVVFDINDHDVLIPVLGEGCAVQTKGMGFTVMQEDVEKIRKIAEEKNIKIQEEKAPRGFGKTNLAKLQRQGVKNGVAINVPVRDQHLQLSTTNLFDANEAVRLISWIVM